MPKSKKPRRKHRQLNRAQAFRASIALTDLIMHHDTDWSDEKRAEEILLTLEDINALLAMPTKPGDSLKNSQWARIKTQLLVGVALAKHTDQCDQLLREIAAGNNFFQVAFNHWKTKNKLLKTNLLAVKRCLNDSVLELKFAYSPYEVWRCYRQLDMNQKFMDELETWLDSKVKGAPNGYILVTDQDPHKWMD